ncbi:hypothetical protein FDECE_12010 [Fusarium decemcellulare]|nr:hypothetical protein FDECE_12010 [Fusarium decemcellulare]
MDIDSQAPVNPHGPNLEPQHSIPPPPSSTLFPSSYVAHPEVPVVNPRVDNVAGTMMDTAHDANIMGLDNATDTMSDTALDPGTDHLDHFTDAMTHDLNTMNRPMSNRTDTRVHDANVMHHSRGGYNDTSDTNETEENKEDTLKDETLEFWETQHRVATAQVLAQQRVATAQTLGQQHVAAEQALGQQHVAAAQALGQWRVESRHSRQIRDLERRVTRLENLSRGG